MPHQPRPMRRLPIHQGGGCGDVSLYNLPETLEMSETCRHESRISLVPCDEPRVDASPRRAGSFVGAESHGNGNVLERLLPGILHGYGIRGLPSHSATLRNVRLKTL